MLNISNNSQGNNHSKKIMDSNSRLNMIDFNTSRNYLMENDFLPSDEHNDIEQFSNGTSNYHSRLS